MEQSLQQKGENVIEWLKKSYSGIRVGKPTPFILDGIEVVVYNKSQPLKNVASVTIADTTSILIAPWDTSILKNIEESLVNSRRGFSITTTSKNIRVVIPPLTTEIREQYKKECKSLLEEAKISLKNIRNEEITLLQNKEKSKEISKDELATLKKKIQKQIDDTQLALKELLEEKIKELSA